MFETNPYQPPRQRSDTAELFAARIDFDGSVTVDHVAALLGAPVIRVVLRVVSLVLVGILLTAGTSLVIAARSSFALSALAVLAVVIGLVMVLFGFDRLVSAPRSARRLIKNYPEMVGAQHGYLDSFGLTFFHSGSERYLQFSWAAFSYIKVTDAGIRFEREEPNFFSVPAHCIKGFEKTQVRQIIDAMRMAADQPAVYQVLPDWSDAPAEAIRLQNHLMLKPPASGVMIALHWGLTIATYGIGIAAVFLIYHDAGAVITGVVGVAAIALSVLQAESWKRISPNPYYIRQWGWITETTVDAQNPYEHHRFRWSEATDIQVSQEMIRATLDNASPFTVTPDSLIGDKVNDDWSKLSDWVETASTSAL